HVLMNTQRRRGCASDCLNAISILCKESQNLFRGLRGRARRDPRPFQKERQPLFPGTVCPYALKQLVVPLAICFEVQPSSIGTLGSASFSKSNRSENDDCVPSIWDDKRASFRI